MIHFAIDKVFNILQENKKNWQDMTLEPLNNNPFLVLAGCLLSLRTQDPVTRRATERLFARADTPHSILLIPESELANLIYPVGFYRQKARYLREISHILVERYDSQVPDTLDELLQLPGVGRKTANLVLTKGFGLPGICVDTHVHRITNRWGYVRTKTPEQTEMALRDKLSPPYWIPINTVLVLFGQNVCLPRRPRCLQCPIETYCEKHQVESGKPPSGLQQGVSQ
ncbi:MAG TPA: endonuclease III [Atribacteraceae bacterium]|nr:endonuclease III [Atribacteraceae bacterium]